MKKNQYIILGASFLLCILVFGCRKFVEVTVPPTAISTTTAFSNDNSASAVMTGVFETMIQSNPNTSGGRLPSLTFIAGLSADELKKYYSGYVPLVLAYTNALNSAQPYYWSSLFGGLAQCNAVLAGVSASTGMTQAEKEQLTGEAKFMRAFFNFYGTNLYGDFPIVTTTNFQTNNTISRSPQKQVYQQIIADLQSAQSLLPTNFVNPTGQTVTNERVRPNKWAATAFLARAYLYYANLGNTTYYAKADSAASAVIANTSLFTLLPSLTTVFKANSQEQIWSLQPVAPGYNTFDAYNFILTSTPGSSRLPVAIASTLTSAFEPGDNRFSQWVGTFTSNGTTYYYPHKYTVNYVSGSTSVSEYLVVLRLAEQYLIRAEAEAQMDDLPDAANDLNQIRNRAGLLNTTAATQSDLLTAIYHENQIEFFCEWGHRWFDLKRTGLLNSVMGSPGENVTAMKGGTWTPNAALFPIPQSELIVNPKLGQNPGY